MEFLPSGFINCLPPCPPCLRGDNPKKNKHPSGSSEGCLTGRAGPGLDAVTFGPVESLGHSSSGNRLLNSEHSQEVAESRVAGVSPAAAAKSVHPGRSGAPLFPGVQTRRVLFSLHAARKQNSPDSCPTNPTAPIPRLGVHGHETSPDSRRGDSRKSRNYIDLPPSPVPCRQIVGSGRSGSESAYFIGPNKDLFLFFLDGLRGEPRWPLSVLDCERRLLLRLCRSRRCDFLLL